VRAPRALGLLAALLLAGTCARAQNAADLLNATGGGRNVLAPTGAPPGSAPMSRPVDPTEYVVGPGDLLQINLSGGVTRSWDAMILP